MININNKIKQFFGGNWGTDKFIKRDTEIDYNVLENEVPKHGKKKKKVKKVWLSNWKSCPFCGEELPIDEKEIERQKQELPGGLYSIWTPRVKQCKCGAIEHSDCPACHRTTWLKDKIYKHQRYCCGFEGERIIKES